MAASAAILFVLLDCHTHLQLFALAQQMGLVMAVAVVRGYGHELEWTTSHEILF